MESVRILVVEDEGIVALQIRTELELLGHSVVGTCHTGETALEAVEALGPDLVLMDIRLAGEMDGIQAAEAIAGRHDVPVVFLTAHSEEGTVDRAGAADPYGYIVKPFDSKDLRIGIRVALLKHRSDRARRQVTEELKTSLEKVRQLSGLLPICVSCKKIRDDRGYWEAIESYISRHSEAEFSHGICTECMQRLYPEYAAPPDP